MNSRTLILIAVACLACLGACSRDEGGRELRVYVAQFDMPSS